MKSVPFSPPFRAAIFDLDGTLVDGYAGILASLNPVLVRFGRRELTLAESRRLVGHGLPALMESLVGPEDVPEAVRLFRVSYRETGPRGTFPLPGAVELLRDLSGAGIPAAVASNKPIDSCRQLLAALGLLPYLVAVQAPGEGMPQKPDPAMVYALLPLLGGEPSATLFVGDMTVDVETARAAGLPVAALPTGSSTREALEAARPDRIVESLEKLRPFFGL